MKEKIVKRYKFEYFFGERYLAFVQFQGTMTVNQIENELFWAKAYFPLSFDGKGIIIKCIVKTFEWSRFIKNNKKRLMQFSIDEKCGKYVSIKTDKNVETIFYL